jgi:transposase
MAKTLSPDLRCRPIGAVEGGMSRRAAAERFEFGVATAIRWVREFRATGLMIAKPKGGDLRSHRIEAFRAVILGAIEAQVDITLVELSEMLRREHGASFAPSTVWRFLDRHAVTFKKTAHASEQERSDLAARPQAWFDAQPDLDPERLVFIDETGASTKMARLRGRVERGRRCRSPVPHGHWKTTTFTGALRLSGLTAPMSWTGR